MAVWYDKETDIVGILDPRQGAGIPLGFKDEAWTEARIGGFVSGCAASGDNTAWATETVAVSSAYDQFMVGIKNSAFQNSVLGQADCDFWGISGLSGNNTVITNTSGGVNVEGGVTVLTSDAGTRFSVANGATVNGASVGSSSNYFNIGTKAAVVATTGFCRFFGIRIIITDRGLSSQTVRMYLSINGNTAHTDTAKATLQSLLTNMTSHTLTDSGSITANDGATAFPVPDSFYVRCPFISNRFRFHNVMAMMIA